MASGRASLPCEQVVTSDTLQTLVTNIKSKHELGELLSPFPSLPDHTASPSISTTTKATQRTPRPSSPQHMPLMTLLHIARRDVVTYFAISYDVCCAALVLQDLDNMACRGVKPDQCAGEQCRCHALQKDCYVSAMPSRQPTSCSKSPSQA